MIELLSITIISVVCICAYIYEITLHKNKIKFDLLKDRK